jgi:Cupin-like domain
VNATPGWTSLLTEALILSCLPAKLCERQTEVVNEFCRRGYSCCEDIAMLVEDRYLGMFYAKPNTRSLTSTEVPLRLRPSSLNKVIERSALRPPFWRLIWDGTFHINRFFAFGKSNLFCSSKQITDELPRIAIASPKSCKIEDCRGTEGSHDILRCLNDDETPTLYKGLASSNGAVLFSRDRHSPERLMKSNRIVDARVSPSNLFTFCRSSHTLISGRRFTAPSVRVRVTEAEFATRCMQYGVRRKHMAPIAYSRAGERIYMQSVIPLSESVLEGTAARDPSISLTQSERVWVSCAGTVSTMHYDASASVLIQVTGCKRLVMFPPQMIEFLGIYPEGHPLHRRSRVDLTCTCRANSSMFDHFWRRARQHALEAILEPGDVFVFPTAWAHYTESLTYSVSHTIRWVRGDALPSDQEARRVT